jgi:transketolase
MRNAFIDTLVELADLDERIVLLTGDLGFTVLEPFAERYPDRFYNVGVAEQNMIGVATGLAESGLIPFAYSIATFASMRPYEFIRNGPVLHQLPVRIVGIGGGFDYGHNGATHYALEDIGMMRLQRGLTVVVPADDRHARSALAETYALERPVYYRISKSGRAIPGLSGRFEPGRLAQLRSGRDVALLAVGPIVS